MAADSANVGKIEHWVMTHVIPESVRRTWNEWVAYFKQAEKKQTGEEHIADAVDKAGWGVEEAQERHREEASKLISQE